jgi:hypothetical protein
MAREPDSVPRNPATVADGVFILVSGHLAAPTTDRQTPKPIEILKP